MPEKPLQVLGSEEGGCAFQRIYFSDNVVKLILGVSEKMCWILLGGKRIALTPFSVSSCISASSVGLTPFVLSSCNA